VATGGARHPPPVQPSARRDPDRTRARARARRSFAQRSVNTPDDYAFAPLRAFRVAAAFRAAALRLRVAAPFFPAARRLRVSAAFLAASDLVVILGSLRNGSPQQSRLERGTRENGVHSVAVRQPVPNDRAELQGSSRCARAKAAVAIELTTREGRTPRSLRGLVFRPLRRRERFGVTSCVTRASRPIPRRPQTSKCCSELFAQRSRPARQLEGRNLRCHAGRRRSRLPSPSDGGSRRASRTIAR
jgi:hypothetical protein